MSAASPTAYLLWAILSLLFLGFLLYHLWSYDKFRCLLWSSGRQPGAFKRVMTYSYLGSVPLFVVYSVATTVIKFQEGYIYTPDHHVNPTPLDLYSPFNKRWILPLNFIFSIAWGMELITHLEELAFWLYLLHQNPDKEEWFSSWEYRMWFLGSLVAVIGMPLTALIARHDVDTLDAWIFLVGSSGSTGTTICFLYVLFRFPAFVKHVKGEGADPSVVVRLTTFYTLNLFRVVFRFLFTIPLFILALDGIIGTHKINQNLFWTDFLTMVAGIGCFVSTTITLLIFFPRSMVKESGYKPKLPTMNSPKSEPITPPMLISGPFESSQGYRGPHPTQAESEEWYDDEETSVYHSDYAVPPYAGSPTSQVIHAGVQLGPQVLQPVHQRQPFPHSMSSPHVIGSPQSTPTLPLSPVSDMSQHFNRPSRHMKTRSMVIPVDLQRRESTSDSHDGLGIVVESSISTLGKKTGSLRVSVPAFENQDIPTARPRATSNASPMVPTHRHHARQRSMTRPSSTLHPYVRTFTSPIDLVDLEVPADLPTRTV